MHEFKSKELVLTNWLESDPVFIPADCVSFWYEPLIHKDDWDDGRTLTGLIWVIDPKTGERQEMLQIIHVANTAKVAEEDTKWPMVDVLGPVKFNGKTIRVAILTGGKSARIGYRICWLTRPSNWPVARERE